MGFVKNLYLIAYNLACAAGWAFVLFRTITALQTGGATAVWDAVELPLKIVQTAAALEVVHAATGIVRSAAFTTAVQVASRLFVLWMILDISPAAQQHWACALTCISWSLVEVPRYVFYALNIVGRVPHILTYLRYSLFMVLYPSGITGEVASILAALPDIGLHEPFSAKLPNHYNLAFDFLTVVYIVLVLYIPGSPFMYSHMLRQRRKVLGGAEKKQH